MKKNFLLVIASAFTLSISASATNYIFHGNVSGDMLDVANWYEVSGTPSIWGIPFNGSLDFTFKAATALPTESSNSGVGRYYYETKDKVLCPPTNLYVGSSASLGHIIFSEGSANSIYNHTIWLGSENKSTEDFVLTMSMYESGSYQGAQDNFYINSTASQKSFTLKVTGKTYLTNDIHNWGEYNYTTGSKAFDKIELNNLSMVYQKVYLNTYSKSYHISGNVNLNESVDSKNATEPANKWTIIVPENALVEGTPLVQIDGKLIRREDAGYILSTVVFDFNWSELDEGEYTLMSVTGGLQGFTNGDGIEITQIDETIWTTKWEGNNLLLVSVPEPTAFAAIFAAAALALAAYRKRK